MQHVTFEQEGKIRNLVEVLCTLVVKLLNWPNSIMQNTTLLSVTFSKHDVKDMDKIVHERKLMYFDFSFFWFAHELQKLHRWVIFLLFISNSKNKCYLFSLFPKNVEIGCSLLRYEIYFFCCTLSVGRTTDRFLSACLLFYKTLTLLVHQNFKLFHTLPG